MLVSTAHSGAPEIDNWGGGGHIFIYSCYAQLISFEIEIKILKSIVFTVCEQEYMNMCPPPPLPIIDLKRVKTNWGKQTFSYLSLNDFNTLPSAVKDTNSLSTFKLHFK